MIILIIWFNVPPSCCSWGYFYCGSCAGLLSSISVLKCIINEDDTDKWKSDILGHKGLRVTGYVRVKSSVALHSCISANFYYIWEGCGYTWYVLWEKDDREWQGNTLLRPFYLTYKRKMLQRKVCVSASGPSCCLNYPSLWLPHYEVDMTLELILQHLVLKPISHPLNSAQSRSIWSKHVLALKGERKHQQCIVCQACLHCKQESNKRPSKYIPCWATSTPLAVEVL